MVIIILAVLGTIYFVGKSAVHKFFLRDAVEVSQGVIPKPPSGKTDSQPAPVEGGSFTTSLRNSLTPQQPATTTTPVAVRYVDFKFRPMPTTEQVNQIAQAGLTVTIDPVSRSMFLRGPYDVVADVGDYYAKTDKVPADCALRGWIVFVSDTDAKAFDITAAFNLPTASTTDFQALLESGKMILDLTAGDLRASISFLSESEGVQLLQEPQLRLVHQTESRIESTEEVPIPTTTISNGLATASIDYKKVGLELAVTPEFLSSDRVRLNVLQIGGIVGRTVTVEGNEIPVLQTQKLQSHVELSVGQTVLLGGVKTSRQVKTKGILSRGYDLQQGYTFVVLSTYHDAPKAVLPGQESEIFGIPSPADFDGSLLPAKGFLDALKPSQIDTDKGGRIGASIRK